MAKAMTDHYGSALKLANLFKKCVDDGLMTAGNIRDPEVLALIRSYQSGGEATCLRCGWPMKDHTDEAMHRMAYDLAQSHFPMNGRRAGHAETLMSCRAMAASKTDGADNG